MNGENNVLFSSTSLTINQVVCCSQYCVS